jgi:hypothetical protein
MTEERQVLHCTNCGRTVRFTMNFGLDGNHEIECPGCHHIHYRVVQGGKITEERWRSSMPTYCVTSVTADTTATSFYTYAVNSTASSTMTSAYFLWDSWNQTT